MSNVFSNPNILVLVAGAFASIIAEEQSLENVNILSEFFSALGDNLALIAAQEEARKQDIESKKNQ